MSDLTLEQVLAKARAERGKYAHNHPGCSAVEESQLQSFFLPRSAILTSNKRMMAVGSLVGGQLITSVDQELVPQMPQPEKS